MSSQQQKSRRMEKQGLGYGNCAAQMNAKPFSIRHYVLMSRQQNITQSWPFPQKYLKLCLNNGISNILPPLESADSPTDSLHGRLVIDLSLDEKQNNGFGKIRGTKLVETERISKPRENSSFEDTIRLLCGKLGRLSLSFDGISLVRQKQNSLSKLDSQISAKLVHSYKAHNSISKNRSEKGRRRKTKTKSLVEILAVAKRCILDGNDRIIVSGCNSTFEVQSGDGKSKRNFKSTLISGLNSRSSETKEAFSLMKKKHQRSDDSMMSIAQCNKRRRSTMGMMNYRNEGCKLSWGENFSSCKKPVTEKKPGGFERKALERYASASVVELQDHHGNY